MKEFKERDGIYHGQVKKGNFFSPNVKHGRGVMISKADGVIVD